MKVGCKGSAVRDNTAEWIRIELFFLRIIIILMISSKIADKTDACYFKENCVGIIHHFYLLVSALKNILSFVK